MCVFSTKITNSVFVPTWMDFKIEILTQLRYCVLGQKLTNSHVQNFYLLKIRLNLFEISKCKSQIQYKIGKFNLDLKKDCPV